MPTIGTTGNDRLRGSWRNDEMYGLEGNDVFEGSGGADHIDGGSGKDTVDYSNSGNSGFYTLTNPFGGSWATNFNGVVVDLAFGEGSWGHARNDTYTSIENVTGSAYNDWIRGNSTSNMIIGGAGDDEIEGLGGGDRLDGGTGFDTLQYSGSNAAVKVDLLYNTATGGDATGDTIANFEGIIGSRYNDVLLGGKGDNNINGNSGDDRISGRDGNDILDGGEGNDIIDGGIGDDTITGGMNANTLTGGDGADTFLFYAVNAGTSDVITDFKVGVDTIKIDLLDTSPDVQFTMGEGGLFIHYNTLGGPAQPPATIFIANVATAQDALAIINDIEFV